MSDVVFSRASLNATELPAYEGIGLADIRLVISQKLADEALELLMASDAIGFDTESKPTFLKGELSTGPHLVQLSSADHAYLFPVACGCGNPALKTILESPGVLKVGFGLGNDKTALQSRLGIRLNNVLDLGEVLRSTSHRGTVGAKVAVAHFFGQKLAKSKKIGTSNWSLPKLSERQILYAANDAHVALRLYRAWCQNRQQFA